LAQLIVVEGPNRGRTYDVTDRATIGTAGANVIVLEDRRASERQAEIRRGDGSRYEILNLEPRKTLLVNGEVVQKKGRLQHGDWITIADTTLVFSEEAPAPRAKPVEAPSISADDLLMSVTGRRAIYDSADSVIELFDPVTSETAMPLVPGLGPGGQPGQPGQRKAESRLATLYRIATAISSEIQLPKLLDRILEIVFEVFPADRGFILLLDEDDRKLKPMASKYRGAVAPPREGEGLEISRTIIREAFQKKEGVISIDAMADERFSLGQSIASASIRSVMCVPFVRDNKVLGVIQLDTAARSRAFTHGDLDLMTAIAMQAATAIENARAYKRRQEYSRSLIFLSRATQRLSSFLERERILKEAVKAACSLLGCTKGSVILRRETDHPRPGQSPRLQLQYAVGMTRELATALDRSRVGLRFARRVIETGEPLLVPSVRDFLAAAPGPGATPPPGAPPGTGGGGAGVDLRTTIGAVDVPRHLPAATAGDAGPESVDGFGPAPARQPDFDPSITSRLALPDFPPPPPGVPAGLGGGPGGGASVAAALPGEATVGSTTAFGADTPAGGTVVGDDENTWSQDPASARRPPISLEPDARDPAQARYQSDSFLIVPIFAQTEDVERRQQPIGCLCVTDKLSRAPFSGNDLELLQILASQTGIALANAELYEKATIDVLTKVYVRRHFFQRLEVAVRNAAYTGQPLSLIMIDLDHFKRVNDTRGHQAGDQVLKAFGRLLKRSVRSDMTVARYGGEEFAIIVPGANLEVAGRVGERIRRAVEEHAFRAADGELRMTASVGCAELLPRETRESLIERADRALYAAKQSGRNRVMVAPMVPLDAPPPPTPTRLESGPIAAYSGPLVPPAVTPTPPPAP